MEEKLSGPPSLLITKRVKQLIEDKKEPTTHDLLLCFYEMTEFNTFILNMCMELADYCGRLQLQFETKQKTTNAQVSAIKNQVILLSIVGDVMNSHLITSGVIDKEKLEKHVNEVIQEKARQFQEKKDLVENSSKESSST